MEEGDLIVFSDEVWLLSFGKVSLYNVTCVPAPSSVHHRRHEAPGRHQNYRLLGILRPSPVAVQRAGTQYWTPAICRSDIVMATCGQSTQQNATYFVNPGYPSAFDGTGSCQLTIHKAHPEVCQYRIDFDKFVLAAPEPVNNVCNNDQFIVSGGNPIPGICGVNSGNHMYVNAGSGNNSPITLTVVTSGPSFGRMWKMKISQIPCNSIYRAEEGCLQYFTGVSGQVKSFNYDPVSGLQLSNQDYSACIRVERNFCGIQYTACSDLTNNRSHAFALSGDTSGQNPVTSMVGGIGPSSCASDWIIIPCATNVGRPPTSAPTCVDRICGGTFSSEVSTTAATVQ
ncbi:unnamed protein product [Nezara viridula]|uniref:CUB domain-containing protein n=1 Tax=Nezara viridula TaxID=85310 RepID=A0A9P0GX17_NEZVI|nr:unnamed protein product [Nezara viridula]